MIHHIKLLGAAVLLTSLGCILVFAGRPRMTHGPEMRAPGLLRDARAFDPDGCPIDVSTLLGHVVALHFWASWCSYCRKELPEAAATYARLRPLGLEIIAVSLDEDRDAAAGALRDRSIRWSQVYGAASSRRLADDYQVHEIPHVILMDDGGRILWSGVPDDGMEIRIAKFLRARIPERTSSWRNLLAMLRAVSK